MVNPGQPAFDLCKNFVSLDEGGGARTLEVTPDFWSRLMGGEIRVGRLMGVLEMNRDSPGWEMHPKGEELLVMLSGAMDLVLEEEGGERVVEMSGGAAFLVPRGIWHQLILREPGQLLFITAGEGTEHRPS
jgi:mannose-6-phosphate isomerase-like protein (cupin superfamily)